MEKHEKLACLFLAALKNLYLMHQHHHWISKGENFYGDHLLFQRIYEGVSEDLDLAAEKFMGVFGDAALDYSVQNKILSGLLNKYEESDSLIEKSLKAEKDFIKLCDTMYKTLKSLDKMTLGLDDMIMSIASKREEAVYLLQQAAK